MKKINIFKVIFVIILFVVILFALNCNLKTEEVSDDVEDVMKSQLETENLDGKKIALIGDSLIAGYGNENGGLDYYLKNNLSKSTINNYSVSGSTITSNTGTDGIVIKNQINNIVETPDIIIFNGGANDCIGYAMGFLSREKENRVGTADNLVENTLIYDFEATILEMKNKFPNAKIFYLQMCLLDDATIYNLVQTDELRAEISNKKTSFFNEAIKVCDKYDVSYIDVSDNFESTALEYRQADWIHINDKGYNLIINEIIEELNINWKAKFIRGNDTREDLWSCFRKKFNVDTDINEKIVAKISVDSQYWLYINGKSVVKQGGLKRGEDENSIYYENIDITDYIIQGENTIAVLTWYWGDTSISYVASGSPGFLFQAQIGDNLIVSDSTWKTSIHTAYLHSGDIPNYRLAEYNEYYDANFEMVDWYMPDFDDSSWQNSIEVCKAGELPFGKLIKRDIPLFKYYGFKEYENMADYADYITSDDEKIEMIIPYNAQFTPYLKIEAPSGLKITIRTDQFEDVNGNALYTTYITKDGIQEYEALSWINGEKVYYEIPARCKNT